MARVEDLKSRNGTLHVGDPPDDYDKVIQSWNSYMQENGQRITAPLTLYRPLQSAKENFRK